MQQCRRRCGAGGAHQRLECGRLGLAAQRVVAPDDILEQVTQPERFEEAHELIPGSRLVVFDDVGHLPQVEAPGRFIAALQRFLRETEPAEFDRDQWRARFKAA